MSHPFRIAHLIDTLSWGGAQKLLVTFAEVARSYAIVPTVISMRPRNDSPFTEELEALGVRVVVLPFRQIFEPNQLAQLYGILRRERFDVLHTHLTQANIVGGTLGPLTGTPVVSSVHNTVARVRRMHEARQFIEANVLRFGVRRVIAVGHVVAEAQHDRLRHTKMVTIPNAVSLVPSLSAEERRAMRAELMGDPSCPLLISVGRLTAQKGYGDLLTAFVEVLAKHPKARLAIAGRGDLQEALVAQVKSLGLEGQAFILGARADVPRLLAASDMFVSSSHWEGLPIAVLEGMSAGLPVVATRVGDMPHVVPESVGIVVEPQQPAQLAAAIIQLLDHPEQMQACGKGARAHILHAYSPEVWFKRLLELYSQVGRRTTTLRSIID